MTSRIPPLLEPYLSLPPETSLILLTNVLGASTNWLVLRYLYSTLALASTSRGAKNGIGELEGFRGGDADGAVVVLVSFLRDMTYWREGARRLGLDLSKLAAQRRFAFVDGLSGLFLPGTGLGKDGEVVLRSAELGRVYEGIMGAVRSLEVEGNGSHSEKLLLVIDGLDLLLATAGPNASSVGMGDMLMDLREQVHATVLTISNDSPLLHRQHTPLEINHAALLLSIAHQAHLTMSLRLLDTGTARDISGVIRIAVGEVEMAVEDLQMEAKEFLYFVGGDGNVKVFERGQ